MLVDKVVPFRQEFLTTWFKITHILYEPLQIPVPGSKSLALLYREIQRQAGMLAFNDSFIFLGTMTMFLIPLTLILRQKNKNAYY